MNTSWYRTHEKKHHFRLRYFSLVDFFKVMHLCCLFCNLFRSIYDQNFSHIELPRTDSVILNMLGHPVKVVKGPKKELYKSQYTILVFK